MRLNPPLLVLFLLIQSSPQAQSPETGFIKVSTGVPSPLSGYRAALIRLAGIKVQDNRQTMGPGFFSHFEVIDERGDTARIGVHYDNYRSGNSHNRQLVFARPASAEIADYLNTRFSHPQAPCTALIVIRILWLTDANHSHEDMLKDPDKRLDKTRIRLRAEIYAEKDNVYVPLFRFDSTLLSQKDNYRQYGRDLAGMLEDLADSSTVEAGKKWVGGRRLTLDDIRHFNQSRFDAAIFRGGSLAPGVYRSFSEFRNNNPSITGFEIKKEKDNLLLYLKEAGGQSYYSHNAWGYCDGTNVFVMKDGVLNPAWKEGKAWYLFGQARIEDPGSSPVLRPGAPVTNTGPVGGIASVGASSLANGLIYNAMNFNQVHVFTVDLDTGILY